MESRLSKLERPAHDISLRVDTYDELFSDFDPRPFQDRNISDDFLYELKRIIREADTPVSELRLYIPAGARDNKQEEVISKRLHSYFRKSQGFLKAELRSKKRRGAIFTLTGSLMMVAASYISLVRSENFFLHTVQIILEPAGWFMVWNGLEILWGSSRKNGPDRDFFDKVAKSKILFVSA